MMKKVFFLFITLAGCNAGNFHSPTERDDAGRPVTCEGWGMPHTQVRQAIYSTAGRNDLCATSTGTPVDIQNAGIGTCEPDLCTDPCTQDSECTVYPTGQMCYQTYCRAQCVHDTDCPNSQVCIQVQHNGPVGMCVPIQCPNC